MATSNSLASIETEAYSNKHSVTPKSLHTIDPASPSNFQKIVAEVVGTYFLIFIGCGSALTANEKLPIIGVAIVWSMVLMAAIFAVGHISGAHFNPAVTMAFAAMGNFSWKHVPMYVLSQFFGATTASLTLKALFSHLDNIEPTMTRYSYPTTDLQAIIWEIIITFILMFTICSVATDHRANKDLAPFAISAALLVNVMVVGPITGASMNPVRSLGPAITIGVYKNVWVYIVSPVIGALAAVFVYNMLRNPKETVAKQAPPEP